MRSTLTTGNNCRDHLYDSESVQPDDCKWQCNEIERKVWWHVILRSIKGIVHSQPEVRTKRDGIVDYCGHANAVGIKYPIHVLFPFVVNRQGNFVRKKKVSSVTVKQMRMRGQSRILSIHARRSEWRQTCSHGLEPITQRRTERGRAELQHRDSGATFVVT